MKDNRVHGVLEIEADTMKYDRKAKMLVFRRFTYDDEEIVAVFPESGINGVLRA